MQLKTPLTIAERDLRATQRLDAHFRRAEQTDFYIYAQACEKELRQRAPILGGVSRGALRSGLAKCRAALANLARLRPKIPGLRWWRRSKFAGPKTSFDPNPDDARNTRAEARWSRTLTPARTPSVRRSRLAKMVRPALLIALVLLLVQVMIPAEVDRAARAAIVAIAPIGLVSGIERRRICSEYLLVRGARGEQAGIRPAKPGCAPNERVIRSVFVAPKVARAMRPYWEALEGGYQVGPDTFVGLNWWGWAKYPYRRWILKTSAGGSNPLESGIKNLLNQPGRASAFGKLRNGATTIGYVAHYLNGADSRDRFVTNTMPCLRGATRSRFGTRVAGELCPLILFGKQAAQTDGAERCVWVATALRQATMLGPRSPERAAGRSARLARRIKERAKFCIDKVAPKFRWSRSAIASYKSNIDRMRFPQPLMVGSRILPFANPSKSFGYALPGLNLLLQDLLKIYPPRANTNRLVLTIDAAAQREAFAKYQRYAPKLARKLSAKLCLIDCRPDQIEADVAVVLGRIEGDAIRLTIAITNKHNLLTGPIKKGEGGYYLATPQRSPGSTNKAFLAFLLARRGIDRLCNRYFRGIRNPAGDRGVKSCNGKRGWVSARRAIRESWNLPFIDAVFKLGVPRVKEFLASVGVPYSQDASDAKFARGLVLGSRSSTTPFFLMRYFAAIKNGIEGRAPQAGFPQLYRQERTQTPLDLSTYAKPGVVYARLRSLIAAPLEPGGTLRSLSQVLTRQGCSNAIGKTGSSDSAVQNGVRDKLLVAAFNCGNQRFVAFALIGSPSITIPVGRVGTRDVVRLIDIALTAHLHRRR